MVAIDSGDIVAVNGWFRPGSWTDIEIFRYELMGMLDDGERLEVDNGYRGRSGNDAQAEGDCLSLSRDD